MDTRPLTDAELASLAAGTGVTDLQVTCAGDYGYGPCGTYLDWLDGHCANGHEIEVEVEPEERR